MIILFDIVLLSFPEPTVDDEKNNVPVSVPVPEPIMLQNCIVLLLADSVNIIVDAEVPMLEFEILRLALPVRFSLPSKVTFEAVESWINGPSMSPPISRPEEVGYIVRDV